MRHIVAFFMITALALPALADEQPDMRVVGRWQTFDDKTHIAQAWVRLTVDNGKLSGKIEKIVKPGGDPNRHCDLCQGDRKDKPLNGMTILWDMVPDDDEWSGGHILDPDNGKTYKCTIKIVGDKLEVRGYVGVSLLGRTQTWTRLADEPAPSLR